MEPSQILVKFVKNGRNTPVGAVVAIGRNQVGWSLASKVDRIPLLNRERAVDIATARAIDRTSEDKVPRSVRKAYNEMLDRANRYFK